MGTQPDQARFLARMVRLLDETGALHEQEHLIWRTASSIRLAHGMFPCSGNAGGAKSHIHGEIVDPVLQSELAALQVQTAFGTHTCLSTARSLFSFLQKPSFMLASFTSSLQG